MKGSTIKRGSTWTAYWSTTDPATGRRKQHSKGGFRIAKEARAHLNGIMDQVGQGAWRPDTRMTVAQLLEQWLAAHEAEGIRPATAALYRQAVSRWIVTHVGALDARQLTPAAAGRLVVTLRTSGGRNGAALSPRSVQISVGTLKAATAWANRTGMLATDPLAGFKRPKVTTKEMDWWTESEARAFLAATEGDRLAWAWTLLLARGLRRGEVCGLRWDVIDLDAGQLRIERTRVLVYTEPVVSSPKTARGRRRIGLDPALVAILRRHKATQAAEKLAAGGAYDDQGWLFADELGRPYYPDSLSVWFHEAVARTGARRIRLHDCRHSAASLLLGSGVPVHVVAGMLGHDPAVCLRTYAHLIPGASDEAGAALSARLLG